MRSFSVQGLTTVLLAAAVAQVAYAQGSAATTGSGAVALTASKPTTQTTLPTGPLPTTGVKNGSSTPPVAGNNTLPTLATTVDDNDAPTTGEIDDTLVAAPTDSTSGSGAGDMTSPPAGSMSTTPTRPGTTSSVPSTSSDRPSTPTSAVSDSTTSTTAPESSTTSSVPKTSSTQTSSTTLTKTTESTSTEPKTTSTVISSTTSTTSSTTSQSTTTPTPSPSPTPTATAGASSSKPKRTVVELITTFVDGSISIGKVTKTVDVDESTTKPTKTGGGLYTSTYTQDGQVKIVTGTISDEMNSGALSSVLSVTSTLVVLALGVVVSTMF
ncbi:hypothetical protein GGI14_000519 [Coemansia sp. S680]|nr:hypothetical protein GGI14_000519 [Coemansia sp. S680]